LPSSAKTTATHAIIELYAKCKKQLDFDQGQILHPVQTLIIINIYKQNEQLV